MRQFLLGSKVAYCAAAEDFTKVPAGAFGIFVLEDGVPTLDSAGDKVKTMANIVLGRDVEAGGPVVIPFNKMGFRFVKGEYQPSTKFKATIVVPAPTHVGTYSLIIVKKGKLFNDRSNYTAEVYVADIEMTADKLAEKLVKSINDNQVANGMTAKNTGATITLDAVEKGVDYNVVPADNLTGTEVTIVTKGNIAYGDAAYVTDLACKAAADAGFEYTYEEDIKMYPGYPLDPLASTTKAEDAGFTIFTLNFYEPREVKTVDQVVKQIVQIALPTGAPAIATLETIFKAIAGETE